MTLKNLISKKSVSIVMSLFLMLFLQACTDKKHDPVEVVNARGKSSYHVVKKGDTLEKIAAKYGLSKQQLIQLNQLKSPFKIYVKQRLKVKGKIKQKDPSAYYASGDDLFVENLPQETTKKDGLSNENVLMATNETVELTVDPTLENASEGRAQSDPEILTHKNTKQNEIETLDVQVQKKDTLKDANETGDRMHYYWPVQGKIVQKFGQKAPDGTVQESISIQAPGGTKIKAIAEGEVLRSGKIRELQEWGNIVILKQKDNKVSVYGFLKDVYVQKGQTIEKGATLGTVGMNKAKGKPMLVFQLRSKKAGKLVPVDPMPYFIR